MGQKLGEIGLILIWLLIAPKSNNMHESLPSWESLSRHFGGRLGVGNNMHESLPSLEGIEGWVK